MAGLQGLFCLPPTCRRTHTHSFSRAYICARNLLPRLHTHPRHTEHSRWGWSCAWKLSAVHMKNKEIPAYIHWGFFFSFFFFFLPCSNKWQNQWCTVIQQCNSFHWLWLLARSAICLWLSLSPSLSLSLSFAWICPTFRNITCLPSLSYARGTTPVSPPFRRGVLWVRRHLGYSTSVSWEEKGRKKSKRIHAKKKKIDIYIMFWDPIAPASAFYPKPWDGSASSRNFSCFVRASSFSLSDTGTPRQCTAPWNACCWTLAGLCHQTTSCIGNRGTPLGSYACLLFEAAEKWIIN